MHQTELRGDIGTSSPVLIRKSCDFRLLKRRFANRSARTQSPHIHISGWELGVGVEGVLFMLVQLVKFSI